MSFRDKPLQVRKRIATIVTGSFGIVLIMIMIIMYTHPHPPKHDPERGIVNDYTTFIGKIQSLFKRK
jgi:hypothetical protein